MLGQLRVDRSAVDAPLIRLTGVPTPSRSKAMAVPSLERILSMTPRFSGTRRLGEPSGEVAAFGIGGRQFERLPVSDRCLVHTAQTTEQISAGGWFPTAAHE